MAKYKIPYFKDHVEVEIPEFVDTNTDNIIIVDELPESGEENYLYKLSTNQKFYYWNNRTNKFENISNSVIKYVNPDEINSEEYQEFYNYPQTNVLYSVSTNNDF